MEKSNKEHGTEKMQVRLVLGRRIIKYHYWPSGFGKEVFIHFKQLMEHLQSPDFVAGTADTRIIHTLG